MATLSKVTFDDIIALYPENNRRVYSLLKEEYLGGNLMPFVGAGLSVFCGYKGWPDVLKELSSCLISSTRKEQVTQMIEAGKLLEAAQEIHTNYPRMIQHLSKIVDYEKIQQCDNAVLCASAAYVLPHLFGSFPVMTTNFDRVLEEVYEKHRKKFEKVVSPHESDLLTQMRQSNAHCLFKLHGDIGPGIHDIEKLVFTKDQYDTAYADGSKLVTELSQWFQNKRLLFLGCSLTMDKTMEVLRRTTEQNSFAVNHYAFLESKGNEEEDERRIIDVGRLGISAILYPKGKHDAVRVLLERLLEETNYAAYEELCRCAPVSSPPPGSNRFMYNSGFFPFTGRENELDLLNQFCQKSERISWWAITAPGGMGKSRLVYEFTNAQRETGWSILWLTLQDYLDLSHVSLPVGPCIVVADDIQDHLLEIGTWLITVSARQRSEKLRILLLERDGRDLSSAKWMEIMQSDNPYDSTIPSTCHCSDFLGLEPLSEEDLKTIMINFAAASSKPIAGPDHAQRLLQALQKIDQGLQRPMYALAIADAWCSGKDPTRWNKGQVLDALVNRELDFYYKRLRSIFGKPPSKQMRSELETIIARSCTMPFLRLDSIAEENYPKLSKRANALDLDLQELLKQIGIVHTVTIRKIKKTEGPDNDSEERREQCDAVVLNCPDLVKEFLVLRQAFSKNMHELLLPETWDNNPMQLAFLSRILRDYPEELKEREWFWNSLFAGNPEDDFPAWLYSNLLFGVTAQLPDLSKQATDCLSLLHAHFDKEFMITISFAKGLVNLSAEQPLEERTQTVNQLEELYKNHKTLPDVAGELTVEFAKGLFNLSNKQPLEERTQTVNRLKKLYEDHKNLPDVAGELAVLFAKGLVNLSVEQTLEECIQTVKQLEEIYKEPNNSPEVAGELTVLFANGLVNLSAEQTLEERTQTVNRLEKLYKDHKNFPDVAEELAVEFANGLFNLSIKQTLEECAQTVKRLKELYENHKNLPDVAEELAVPFVNVLFNLSVKQPPDEIPQTIDRLEGLYSSHRNCTEPAVEFAKGLVNLSFSQDSESDVLETISRSRKVLDAHSQNEDIQLSHAQTWFNLTLVQKEADIPATVSQISGFLRKHPIIIPAFKDALDTYLSQHPDHTQRYQPLIDLR